MIWNLDFLEALLEKSPGLPGVDIINLHNYNETWSPDANERIPEYAGMDILLPFTTARKARIFDELGPCRSPAAKGKPASGVLNCAPPGVTVLVLEEEKSRAR